MEETKYNLTHARHDPAHCMAPGLFRSLGPGERKKLKLDVVYQFGEDQIEFSGPEPLDHADLKVLQGLVAMASVSGENGRGIMLTPRTESDAGKQLRLFLDMKWDALEQDAMVVKGSFKALAREIGFPESGNSIRQIKKSIERLWKVSVIVQRGKKRLGFRILSEYASDEGKGKLFIALNPRIASAMTGETPFTYLDMAEARKIKGSNATLIHQRLSGWICAGGQGRVKIETLCEYVWPDHNTGDVTASAKRKRNQRIKKSIHEFAEIGWEFEEYAKGKFKIKRPEVAK
jgi:hypothetical protein